MRIRVGLLIPAVFATLFSPISPSATAFSGYSSAPLNVTATAISGGVRVGWSSPTDVDTGVTGYRVEYSTLGTSGSWTLATTTSSSTYSYDIVALSQVETYIRVAATTAAGVGTYGYPWTKLYSTSALKRDSNGYVTYDSGFGVGVSDPYTTLSGSAFTRIRWRVDTTISSVTKYADIDAYEWVTGDSTQTVSYWTPSVASVMVPSVNSPYAYSTQANITDLNVYSNNNAVTNGKGLNGRLEIWPWNYSQGTSGLTGTGSASNYDYDDTNNLNGSHGSFQIHDMTNLKPIFAWNDTAYGSTPAFNYGKNTNASGHPDWTFCSTTLSAYGACPAPSSFQLQIFVNIPVTPLADVTAPTISRIDARAIGKNGDTITVQSTEVGTVYIVNQSVSVTNFASITAAASANKNSVSISAVSSNTVLTLSSLNDGFYNLYGVDTFNNLSTGILATIKVDNTIPTVNSLAITAAGTAITLTASETITNSLQVSGIYQLNDSGTALTVTGTSFSGNVATLTLSRAVPAGASVVLSYTPGSGAAGGRWIDQAGNEIAGFTNRAVTNNSTTPISITFSVPTTIYKGSSVTISLVVPVTGKVTFTLAGKRLPGCFNRAATGTLPITVSCNWKPALSNAQSLTATFTPTNSSIASATSIVNRFILKRTTTR